MRIDIPLPPTYRFDAMIEAHGWAQLSPFYWDGRSLERVHRLASGNVVHIDMSPQGDVLEVVVTSSHRLSQLERTDLEGDVRWMLQLDEDFGEFYEYCAEHPALEHIPGQCLGPMLRGATVWEDYVKTVCTTNTTWAQTKAMVQRMVDAFGEPLPDTDDLNSFPTPEAIAEQTPQAFADAIRAGYRAPYIHATATEIAAGQIDLEAFKWRAKQVETEEFMLELRALPGVGPYAAAHIAMLLGSYGYVPVDSWARSLMQKHLRGGEVVTDQDVHAHFAPFGRWKALAYRHWKWETEA
jgi:3-methyladenine DNA glycosylase/8-oxoguanine DNA glycosylase